MSQSKSVDTPDPSERERIEAGFTFRRITELELEPVRGNFDAAHLREINRRIFQDLPSAGFDDVTPGQYRPQVPDGKDWVKDRGLETVEGSFFVAYSRMDVKAQQRMDEVLEAALPEQLRQLDTQAFTSVMSKLYAELDFIHPFSDGNSRTLRSFTRQLASESGYNLDWGRFNNTPGGRDSLYVARDNAVNQLAKREIQHENTMRKIVFSMDKLSGNLDLRDLLKEAIRPSRALAFEKLQEAEAIQAYPELKDAYETLHAASKYFEEKLPGKFEAQQQVLKTVFDHVQKRLNEGEVREFGPKPEAPPKAHVTATPSAIATREGEEHER